MPPKELSETSTQKVQREEREAKEEALKVLQAKLEFDFESLMKNNTFGQIHMLKKDQANTNAKTKQEEREAARKPWELN